MRTCSRAAHATRWRCNFVRLDPLLRRPRPQWDKGAGDTMRLRTTTAAVGLCVFLLSACGPGGDEPMPEKIARAESMRPNDPGLAEKYERSCRICHINPDSGAPLTGDEHAWQPRMAQSREALAAHLRNGFNAMPPRGQCFDCTDDELERLTAFMARRASKQETP